MAAKPANFAARLRRSQMALTYGPGAIINLRTTGGASISAVAGGLEVWDAEAKPAGIKNPQSCHLRRLERKLDVDGFRLAPIAPEGKPDDERLSGLVARRFPSWLTCPKCYRLKPSRKWQKDNTRISPIRWCGHCSEGRSRVHVLPVRFVLACKNGHLGEFPWKWWIKTRPDIASGESTEECEHIRLRLYQGKGMSLSSLILACEKCGKKVRMSGIFGGKAFESLSCGGQRPWLNKDSQETCNLSPVAVQRNSSSLYQPKSVSAIDIPPWSHELQTELGTYWKRIYRQDSVQTMLEYLSFSLEDINEELGTSFEAESLARAVMEQKRLDAEADDDLKVDEYRQLCGTGSGNRAGADFKAVTHDVPASLAGIVETLVAVERLREVRALTGFTRLNSNNPVCALSERRLRWLPAIENRGEGVFLTLRSSFLKEWVKAVKNSESLQRCKQISNAAVTHYEDLGVPDEDRVSVTPGFLLLHSLSHLLIRQISIESGYSAASISERIYSSETMSGVLLYTSTPGAEGTLGGLSRIAEPTRFVRIFEHSLESAQWCSSDPLCIESIVSKSEPLNQAACHACLLLPETSCEFFNHFLDRRLVSDDFFVGHSA